MNKMNSRWGTETITEIEEKIVENVPENTKRNKDYIWKQFSNFCGDRHYDLASNLGNDELAKILEDYAWNMRKINGEDYKESVIKCHWNVVAKMLQEKIFKDYGRKIDPFHDVEFKSARDARDTKRKQLQRKPEMRKCSSVAFTAEEFDALQKYWDEDSPEGLRNFFYFIAAKELAWRGNEGSKVLVQHFQEESDNFGNKTNRIEYNPIFEKTAQGGAKKCASSKWLIPNPESDLCPVRLFRKLLQKRPKKVSIERLFLTPNRGWKDDPKIAWYKNSPIGINTFSTWTKETATKIGIDTKAKKVSNHSHRATAVTHLAQAGVPEQELMKITGHANSNSIQPYLNMQNKRHGEIINKIRDLTGGDVERNLVKSTACSSTHEEENIRTVTQISSKQNHSDSRSMFQNCTFNIHNFNC